jgi:exoribonuclease-2
MTTVAAPHEGLGDDCYAWASSPLRRYVDLVNQWQLLAHLRQLPPPFPAGSEALLAAMRDFELTYAAYADFQRGMERYWCLRWLRQEGVLQPTAAVLRESLVRLEHLPLVLRVPSLPTLDRGARVRLEIERIDFLEADVRARYVEVLPPDDSLAEAEGEGVEDDAVTE